MKYLDFLKSKKVGEVSVGGMLISLILICILIAAGQIFDKYSNEIEFIISISMVVMGISILLGIPFYYTRQFIYTNRYLLIPVYIIISIVLFASSFVLQNKQYGESLFHFISYCILWILFFNALNGYYGNLFILSGNKIIDSIFAILNFFLKGKLGKFIAFIQLLLITPLLICGGTFLLLGLMLEIIDSL